nr:ABC transporter substrate-binding protein [Acidobacteriota bacterium]
MNATKTSNTRKSISLGMGLLAIATLGLTACGGGTAAAPAKSDAPSASSAPAAT